ncbi:hypothetical protein DP067_00655 [Mycoplasmopsis anatis]|uniref:Uncharacterized protein n=1 Tax=Mycoplasmopsis anatis 1340 TaxID=1034808 RepID=F9QDU1_9BACT|nr:hypothetical protein [Mycoplasmopsis anatis]AWX69886.1 hypothetical protein DP067_00655 [Mycoplasmopsis anatis]EGS29118.1 hypothetical protein GIG_02833 [Mycoplasmopsis anatis 1340]VEU73691.1 Uncharacterised protein [Mycoplasmopsis anatis]
MIKQVWSLTRQGYKHWKSLKTVSYKYNGQPITPYHNSYSNNHPLVVFYSGDDVYYLTCRSVEDKIKKDNEVEIFNNKTQEKSYVETNNIHIMKRDDFFKIFNKNKVQILGDIDGAVSILEKLRENLDNQTIKLQKLELNSDWTIENKKINNELEAFQYLAHADNLFYNIGKFGTMRLFEYGRNFDNEKWLQQVSKNYIPLKEFKTWDLEKCMDFLHNSDKTKRYEQQEEDERWSNDTWDYEAQFGEYHRQEELEYQKKKQEKKDKQEDDLALSM